MRSRSLPASASAPVASAAPRVSVVIPTRDRAPLLMEAIESVLQQTYRDLEVIVCDHGSTDGTGQRVQRLAHPVRYQRLEHGGGPGAPRNRGVEAARGELVAFLDDDDLWKPEKLARQVALLEGRAEVGVVYTDRCVVDQLGLLSGPVLSEGQKRPGDFLKLVLGGHFPQLSSALVRRDLLRRVGGFDEGLLTGEDFDLWLRLAGLTRAACVAEPLVLVRRQRDSVSEESGPRAFQNAIEVLERRLQVGDLGFRHRRRGRATLARLWLQLARVLRRGEDSAGARRATLRALRSAPARPSTWGRAAGVWLRPC